MKRMIFSGMTGFLSFLMLFSVVNADQIYNNGESNYFAGVEMTQCILTEDFILATAATISEIKFWTFDMGTTTHYQDQLTWFIFGDNAGKPGETLATGTMDTDPVSLGSHVIAATGYKSCNVWEFDFTIPEFNADANTFYHLGLHNGALTWDSTKNTWVAAPGQKTINMDYYWATSEPLVDDPSVWVWNLLSTPTWYTYTYERELAFQLEGTYGTYLSVPDLSPIPEPVTILLLGLGLMGVTGVKRKLKKCTFPASAC